MRSGPAGELTSNLLGSDEREISGWFTRDWLSSFPLIDTDRLDLQSADRGQCQANDRCGGGGKNPPANGQVFSDICQLVSRDRERCSEKGQTERRDGTRFLLDRLGTVTLEVMSPTGLVESIRVLCDLLRNPVHARFRRVETAARREKPIRGPLWEEVPPKLPEGGRCSFRRPAPAGRALRRPAHPTCAPPTRWSARAAPISWSAPSRKSH